MRWWVGVGAAAGSLILAGLAGCGGSGGGDARVRLFDGQAAAVQLAAPGGHEIVGVHPRDDGSSVVITQAAGGVGADRTAWRRAADGTLTTIGAFEGQVVRALDDGASVLVRRAAPDGGLWVVRDGTVTAVPGVPTDVPIAAAAANGDASVVAYKPVADDQNSVIVRAGDAVAIPDSRNFHPSVIHRSGNQVAGTLLPPVGDARAAVWDGTSIRQLPLPAGRTGSYVQGGTDDFRVLAGHSRWGAPDSQQTLVWQNGTLAGTPEDGEVPFVSADGSILAGYSWSLRTYGVVWRFGGGRYPVVGTTQPWLADGALAGFGHHRVAGLSPSGRMVALHDQAVADFASRWWLIRLP